MSSSWKEQSSL